MISSWRELSAADLEREYSPSSSLPDCDYGPFVAEYRRASDRARARVNAWAGAEIVAVPYGELPSQMIDLAVPTARSQAVPLLVFFHGGYWQELSKSDSFFPAWESVRRGWAFAAVDYTLAPLATLDQIVEECRKALLTLIERSDSLGVDQEKVVVAGSSAGAHLAAMALVGDQAPGACGAILVSGIFELEPLVGTSINDALGLDVSSARANSPTLHDVSGFPRTLLAYGENETSEFKAQSNAFADELGRANVAASVIEVEGRNHFDVILDLAAPGSPLGDAVGSVIESSGDSDAIA